jgi:hypothetical protein
VDDIQVGWAADVGAPPIDAVNAKGVLTTDGLDSNAVYELSGVKLHWSNPEHEMELSGSELDVVLFHVREPGQPALDPRELANRASDLRSAIERRYAVPLGDPDDSKAQKFSASVLIERLLITQPLRVPGVQLIPLGQGNPAESEATILNDVLAELGSTTRVPASWWRTTNEHDRPLSLMRFPEVLAADLDEAASLVAERRNELLDLLALTRGSSGRPLGTVIESGSGSRAGRIYAELDPYTGNLLGGFLSGEDPTALVKWDEAASVDPLLRLCLSLVREAHADRSSDSAYFRYWSILEVLARSRVPRGKSVSLTNGKQWIGLDGKPRTTQDAVPSAYELLRHAITSATNPINEASWVAPAADLQEALNCWYARRNATAHYGAFNPNDATQQASRWYSNALKTVPTRNTADQWLTSFRRLVTDAVKFELQKASP